MKFQKQCSVGGVFFQADVRFCKESAKFLPILTPFGYFNAILRILAYFLQA